jgi:hypothetical protein
LNAFDILWFYEPRSQNAPTLIGLIYSLSRQVPSHNRITIFALLNAMGYCCQIATTRKYVLALNLSFSLPHAAICSSQQLIST